jgi:hypothetical protein
VCADCHPTKSFDQHFAIHSGCVGGECHDGTDINSWHYDGGPSFNLGDPNINCQMCHGSPGTPGGYAGSPWEHDNYGCYSGCHG